MLKLENKKVQAVARAGQAAIELAIFGAILVFILGTIIRTAVGNGYAQNQNFKAMRMAMLNSWQGSSQGAGYGALANTTRNSSSILFVEDRLSPDLNKYGEFDRNPFIAQGAGVFSFQLMYPWQPGVDDPSNLVPIMDVYINGQHFPFTTASYVVNKRIARPSSCTYPANSCNQNQCLRNQREWAGGGVNVANFYNIISVANLNALQIAANATSIFNELVVEGYVTLTAPSTTSGTVNSSTLAPAFTTWLQNTFPGAGQAQANLVQGILQTNQNQYKLFYTYVANGALGPSPFSQSPPQSCTGPNNALCASVQTVNNAGVLGYWNGVDPATAVDHTGDMMYDLNRNGDYNSGLPTSVETQFPIGGAMRNYIGWQWAASAATTPDSIGLNTSNNQFPQYDIDGRLKMVTVFGLIQNADGTPTVTYEDFQGGDIDSSWDINNSCTPKPGLLNNADIYTFTKQGTYLQILEGKMYNPETDQFVRSANKRDTIDLIQRMIQLSNNTGRFCNGNVPQATVSGLSSTEINPVEACVDGINSNCFTSTNFPLTCFDSSNNIIYVRSRLEDRRGTFWFTDTSGQLKVQ